MNSSAAAGSLPAENSFVALPRIPSACTAALNRLSDAIWERRLHIATAGRRDVPYADAVHYEPLPYHAVFRIMERLQLRPEDVLVDVGSGMGRTVCVAARHPLTQVIGVEIDPALHAIGETNVRQARGIRTPVQLRCISATEFDYATATVLWIFNPFGAATMSVVLDRLRESIARRPRSVRIAYINATCAHLFSAQTWLKLEAHWRMSAWSRVKTPVRFYRTI